MRTSLQIWSLPNKSGLMVEESQSQDHYGSSGRCILVRSLSDVKLCKLDV